MFCVNKLGTASLKIIGAKDFAQVSQNARAIHLIRTLRVLKAEKRFVKSLVSIRGFKVKQLRENQIAISKKSLPANGFHSFLRGFFGTTVTTFFSEETQEFLSLYHET